MFDKVLFIEGYHEIPQKIADHIANGWTVYNASRPLLGHDHWQGDFRHGVFFAAVAPAGSEADEFNDHDLMHERNRQLDGHVCEIVTRAQIEEYGRQVAVEYDMGVASFRYDDIVQSYFNMREQESKGD